jgi:hypothetical protein
VNITQRHQIPTHSLIYKLLVTRRGIQLARLEILLGFGEVFLYLPDRDIGESFYAVHCRYLAAVNE